MYGYGITLLLVAVLLSASDAQRTSPRPTTTTTSRTSIRPPPTTTPIAPDPNWSDWPMSGSGSGDDLKYRDLCATAEDEFDDVTYVLETARPESETCECHVRVGGGFSTEACGPPCVDWDPDIDAQGCVRVSGPADIDVNLHRCARVDWRTEFVHLDIFKDGLGPPSGHVTVSCRDARPLPDDGSSDGVDTIALGAGLGAGIVVVLLLGIVIGCCCQKHRRAKSQEQSKMRDLPRPPPGSTYVREPGQATVTKETAALSTGPKAAPGHEGEHEYTDLTPGSTYEELIVDQMSPPLPGNHPAPSIPSIGQIQTHKQPSGAPAAPNQRLPMDTVVDNVDYLTPSDRKPTYDATAHVTDTSRTPNSDSEYLQLTE